MPSRPKNAVRRSKWVDVCYVTCADGNELTVKTRRTLSTSGIGRLTVRCAPGIELERLRDCLNILCPISSGTPAPRTSSRLASNRGKQRKHSA